MIQLLLHLLGDYFLQNDYMAVNKSKFITVGWIMCSLHCFLYAVPFGLYYHSWYIFLAILISHFLVDKFGLAEYVSRLINWDWDKSHHLGFKNRPDYIYVWLHIIRDNSIHIAGNYFIIQQLTTTI